MHPCGSHPHKIASKSTKKPRNHVNIVVFLVEMKGVEPSTSRMRTERSPTELHPHVFRFNSFMLLSLVACLRGTKLLLPEVSTCEGLNQFVHGFS